MKAVNFWKTLFCAALAITAFSACSDDDNDDDGGIPSITVNGKESATLAVKLEGGTTEAVEVVSTGNWVLELTGTETGWCHPSKETGGKGKTSLTFTVDKWEGAASTDERSVTATLTTNGSFEGIPIPKKATIVVKQNGDGSTVVTTNVKAIRALLKAMNPSQTKVDVTAEIAAMTITGVIGSDYAGGNMGSTVYVAVQDSEIAPNSGLILVSSKFTELKLSAGTVVSASLSGAQVGTYGEVIQLSLDNSTEIEHTAGTAPEPYAITVDQILDYESMLVKIEACQPISSIVGKKWTDVYNDGTMEVENGGATFNITTAKSATFKDDVIPDKSGYVQGIASQWLGSAQLRPRSASDIVLNQDRFEIKINYTKGTVAEAIAAGDGKSYEISATVVAMHTQGILIGDSSGVMLAFIGEAPMVAVNDLVTVKGTTELRNGVIQFSKNNLSIEKTGIGSYTTPAAEVLDGAAVDTYIATATANKAVYKYVKYVGVFVVDGDYYNVNISGTSTKGSVAYGKSEWASFNDKPVTVEGWLLGGTSKFLQTMATSVTADTSTPIVSIATPETFAATAPEAQTLTYTATNVSASDVSFEIEGTDAAKFSLGTKTDNSIVVNAVSDNVSDAAYTANLVAKVNGEPLASVQLRQAAPSTGDDTKGIFTWMTGLYTDGQYDSKADYWYFNSKVIPNGGEQVTVLRLGKSKFSGVYTTPALGVTGNKKLSFYAVGWTGIPSTVYVRVNDGGSVSGSPVSVEANTGYAGNPPFTMTLTDSDYYTMELKDLTATSTLTISTSSNFAGEADAANKSRAAVIGLQIY